MKGKKAYQRFLAKEEFKRTKQNKFTYALIDLDSDGIDELLIDSVAIAPEYALFAIKNGKSKEVIVCLPRAVYCI